MIKVKYFDCAHTYKSTNLEQHIVLRTVEQKMKLRRSNLVQATTSKALFKTIKMTPPLGWSAIQSEQLNYASVACFFYKSGAKALWVLWQRDFNLQGKKIAAVANFSQKSFHFVVR